MSRTPLTRPVGHPLPVHGERAGVRGRKSQGGWVGLVVILIALAIVAWLSKDALRKYGLLPDTESTLRRAGVPTEGAATDAVQPPPASVLDKARSVEGILKESEKRGGGGN